MTAGPFAQLFDSEVICLEGDPLALAPLACLSEDEAQAIAEAVPKRQLQYKATRYLARRVFSQLGHERTQLLNNADRSPAWPSGFVGSVTHSEDWCAVAVASDERVQSVGIDVEHCGRLSRELVKRVLTPSEISALETEERVSSLERWVALLFSAKESLYKCQYPLSRQFLGFQDVELRLRREPGEFTCHFLKPVSGLLDAHSFEGRYAFDGERVVTRVIYRRSRGAR